jgi:hypothetical protein
MSVVFVLGAGASFGESLQKIPGSPDLTTGGKNPRLAKGFFDGDYLSDLGYSASAASNDFPEALEYLQTRFLLTSPPGEGEWKELNIEEAFTSVELDQDFESPGSERGGRLTIIRNQLIGFIGRIIGLSTQYKCGKHVGFLKENLEVGDSVVNFNYDLILDQEFVNEAGLAIGQYNNFFVLSQDRNYARRSSPILTGPNYPMYLKPHGSLNSASRRNRRSRNRSTGLSVMSSTRLLDITTLPLPGHCVQGLGRVAPYSGIVFMHET